MWIWLRQILDNRLSRYCCWCCWGECCWLFMRRCCVNKKKRLRHFGRWCMMQGQIAWLNNLCDSLTQVLGHKVPWAVFVAKSTIGDFDSDQSRPEHTLFYILYHVWNSLTDIQTGLTDQTKLKRRVILFDVILLEKKRHGIFKIKIPCF